MTTHHPRATVTEQQAAVLACLRRHLPKDRYDEAGHSAGTYCTCGDWTGNYFAEGEAGLFDDHLAAAIVAECLPGDAEGGL